MLETPRLTLIPLNLEQLVLYTADTQQLEEKLGLQMGHRILAEPVLSIVTYFTIPRVQDPALNPLFHTMWMAIDRQKRQFVAEAKFKGEPDETGTVEIGYGTYPTLHRQGYMTEMVSGLLAWAVQQPGICRVVADTEIKNTASQRVLENNGFRQFDQVEGMLWWEYVVDKIPMLTFDSHGYLTPYDLQQTKHKVIVKSLLTNDHRQLMWRQFLEFRRELTQKLTPVVCIWLDGSFVSQKEIPNDLDAVYFIDATYLNRQYRTLDNVRSRYPLLHIMFAEHHSNKGTHAESINRIEKFKWFSLFSSKGQKPKGFIELIESEDYGSY